MEGTICKQIKAQALYLLKPQVDARRRVMRYSPAGADDIHDCVVMICQACGLDKKILVPKNEDFLVEMRRIELLSENPLIQPSSWAVCYLSFPRESANRHAFFLGSPFLHDRFKCERPMHVHHSNDAQSEAVVLIGGTGDPQVTALPSLRRSAKIRQP